MLSLKNACESMPHRFLLMAIPLEESIVTYIPMYLSKRADENMYLSTFLLNMIFNYGGYTSNGRTTLDP